MTLRYAPCVTTTSMFVKIVGAASVVIVFITIRTEESAAGLFKVTHEIFNNVVKVVVLSCPVLSWQVSGRT